MFEFRRVGVRELTEHLRRVCDAEEVEISEGRLSKTGLSDYSILRFSEMPEVDVRIIANGEPPGGVGEPPVPLVAPAVANAVFAATGKRLRSMPLRL